MSTTVTIEDNNGQVVIVEEQSVVSQRLAVEELEPQTRIVETNVIDEAIVAESPLVNNNQQLYLLVSPLFDVKVAFNIVDGHLIVTYYDALSKDLGSVVGPPGVDGTDGLDSLCYISAITVNENPNNKYLNFNTDLFNRTPIVNDVFVSPVILLNSATRYLGFFRVTSVGTYSTTAYCYVSYVPQAQANWDETNPTSLSYILNKPSDLVQDANYVHANNGELLLRINGELKAIFSANQLTRTIFDISASDLGVSSALRYIGVGYVNDGSGLSYGKYKLTSLIGDKYYAIQITDTGAREQIPCEVGDVFTCNGKEYVCTVPGYKDTNVFIELGDESNYATKNITITGSYPLYGGGNLTQNRIIYHEKLLGDNNKKTVADIYRMTIDEYGHVTSATAASSLSPEAGGTDVSLVTTGEKYAWTHIADDKMDKQHPSGTGSFSMNRVAGSTVGTNSTTLGGSNTASGTCSLAEGNLTEASGVDSHAEGFDTAARGKYSHVEGYKNVANHKSQHVFGEYNLRDTNTSASTERGDYVEIVGNGTSEQASNARTLDWNGNEVLAGTSTASGFKTPTGTSSQFLMADGSVNNDEYLIKDNPTGTGSLSINRRAGSQVGLDSVAIGYSTIAKFKSQLVFGEYNEEDGNQTATSSSRGIYAEIVGNGTGDNARSNARTLDWDGNEWLAGNLRINKTLLQNTSSSNITLSLPSSSGTLATVAQLNNKLDVVGPIAKGSLTLQKYTSNNNYSNTVLRPTNTGSDIYVDLPNSAGTLALQSSVDAAQSKADDAYDIAVGKNSAVSYTSYQNMVTAFNAESSPSLQVGYNVYIETVGVPDLWVAEVLDTKASYTYTSDQAIVDALDNPSIGYVNIGWYRLCELETAKVDLGDYVEDTITVTGTGALGGGGSLSQNRTITHNAGSAPNVASGLYKISTDAYSHVSGATAVEKSDLTGLIGYPAKQQYGTEYSLVTTGDKFYWDAKQNALASQTAYSAKGTSTKVPQITTNSLGQVTGITEVDISYPEVDPKVILSFNDTDWTQVDGHYMKTIVTTKYPVVCFNSNNKVVMATLGVTKSGATVTAITVESDTPFAGYVVAI